MNEYVKILTRHVAENPPNYGSDAHSILEMLFTYYHKCNNTDTDAVKAAFEDLYQRMHGMPLREMDEARDRWVEENSATDGQEKAPAVISADAL